MNKDSRKCRRHTWEQRGSVRIEVLETMAESLDYLRFSGGFFGTHTVLKGRVFIES
jgi:hypothetical protein